MAFLIGLGIGIIGGVVLAYIIYKNNEKKIAELTAKIRELSK